MEIAAVAPPATATAALPPVTAIAAAYALLSVATAATFTVADGSAITTAVRATSGEPEAPGATEKIHPGGRNPGD